MKLRAPRCSDAVLLTSTSAWPDFQSIWVAPSASLSASAANPGATASSRAPHIKASNARNLMRMVGHPHRLRFRLAHTRINRHQPEEREVQNTEYAGQQHVGAFGRLQAQVTERHERHREHAEHEALNPTLVPDRLHR